MEKKFHSEVSDEGLSSHLPRKNREKSMAAPVAKGNLRLLLFKRFLYIIFIFFIYYFYILFLGLSHPELALSTEIHVILAVMETLLQMNPNQRLPDTNNP